MGIDDSVRTRSVSCGAPETSRDTAARISCQ